MIIRGPSTVHAPSVPVRAFHVTKASEVLSAHWCKRSNVDTDALGRSDRPIPVDAQAASRGDKDVVRATRKIECRCLCASIYHLSPIKGVVVDSGIEERIELVIRTRNYHHLLVRQVIQ